MKNILKGFGIALAAILVLAVLAFAVIVLNEYKPAAVEDVQIQTVSQPEPFSGDTVSVLSYNIGYAGLGDNADFFMDGGTSVRSTSKERVQQNLAGITDTLLTQNTDFVFLQEVDVNSSRSYRTNELEQLGANYANYGFAYNYKCIFVPYPVPPLGTVNSGVATLSNHEIDSAQRVSLPCPFSWPMSAANLKRCVLVSYIPIEGSDKQLVLFNFHLEAYDSGEGKIAQTKQLVELLSAEYEKGNYVIAGGDFNQSLPGALEAFPLDDSENVWIPGQLDDDQLPEGWHFVGDASNPSCRSLDAPYVEGENQLYLIDGFIISPNLELKSINTLDLGFVCSDHDPVRIELGLN